MTGFKLITPIAAAIVAAMAGHAAPAAAQGADRVLIVYGEDPCPTSGSGEEIVVCARKPESERYRIPKELRAPSPSSASASWASRATSIEYAGRSGTDSCSPSGAGGWTGCYGEILRKAREEKAQAKAEGRKAP